MVDKLNPTTDNKSQVTTFELSLCAGKYLKFAQYEHHQQESCSAQILQVKAVKQRFIFAMAPLPGRSRNKYYSSK
jgi:hypothetical protein